MGAVPVIAAARREPTMTRPALGPLFIAPALFASLPTWASAETRRHRVRDRAEDVAIDAPARPPGRTRARSAGVDAPSAACDRIGSPRSAEGVTISGSARLARRPPRSTALIRRHRGTARPHRPSARTPCKPKPVPNRSDRRPPVNAMLPWPASPGVNRAHRARAFVARRACRRADQRHPIAPDRWTRWRHSRRYRGVQAIRFGTHAAMPCQGPAPADDGVDVEGSVGSAAIGFHRRTTRGRYLAEPQCATRPDCQCTGHEGVCCRTLPAGRGGALRTGRDHQAGVSGRPCGSGSTRRARAGLCISRATPTTVPSLQGMVSRRTMKSDPGAVEELDPRPDRREGRPPRAADGYLTSALRREAQLRRTVPRVRLDAAARKEQAGDISRRWPPDGRRSCGCGPPSRRREGRARAIGWNDGLVFWQAGLRRRERLPEARAAQDAGRTAVARERRLRAPLEAGDKRLVVAVANAFFGWGLMRLDDAAGVH